MAGVRAENENNYCEHCLELRRTLVKTLGEKRALLLRLQKEQGRIRKLLKEAEKGKKKDGEEQSNSRDVSRLPCESRGGLCLEQQLNVVLKINKKWKEDYEALELRYLVKKKTLQTELDLTKEKLATAETQVLALGSEVIRLADSLNDMYTREASPFSPLVDMESYEIFKQQIELYKEDFSIERRDRERAQCEKDSLQHKLKDAQEVISMLTQEALKVQRDKLKQFQKKIRLNLQKDHQLLLEGRIENAEVMHEKKIRQLQTLEMTNNQLETLEKMIQEVEFDQVQILKQGAEALMEIKKALDEVLSGRLTEEDQDAFLKQIEEMSKVEKLVGGTLL